MKTPQLPYPKLSQALGLKTEVWLKREDLHHYGSHKGRSIPILIDTYRKEGKASFVISSSGNAALCAAMAVATHNKNSKKEPLSLQIYVGQQINKEKFESLKSKIINLKSKITIEQVPNPKQSAFLMDKEKKAKLLRQSTDDLALLGYQELAKELGKIPELSAVFIPTSSGTTAQGLFLGFKALGFNPQIHIVQTDACHPMVSDPPSRGTGGCEATSTLNQTSTSLESSHPPVASGDRPPQGGIQSLASAIVDKIARRKEKVLEAIKNSRGHGWVATNETIKLAQELVKESTGIIISPNSALSVVGLLEAKKAGLEFKGPVVCLITGK